MTAASIAALLQSALLLLSVAQSTPNLSADFRAHAINVAQTAISDATSLISQSSNTVSGSQTASVAPATQTNITAAEPNTAEAITIEQTKSGCDYFISSKDFDYQLLEWFSGNSPSNGDVYYGDVNGFGFTDISGPSGSMHVWREDYLLTLSQAQQELSDKCPDPYPLSNDSYYLNSSDQYVHSPAYSNDGSVPSGATAQCSDGTYSFSQHRSGTCSHHGGVIDWLQ